MENEGVAVEVDEGYVDITQHPITLHHGAVHLHLKLGAWSKWSWVLVTNNRKGMCGTGRCVRLEVKHGRYDVPCKHEWEIPPQGTVMCRVCGKVEEYELVLPNTDEGND